MGGLLPPLLRACAGQVWQWSDYLRDLVWVAMIKRFGDNATDFEEVTSSEHTHVTRAPPFQPSDT
jgi:hypothetical protein